jgi:hypothetical protein
MKFSYDFKEFQFIFPEIFTDGLHGPKYPRKAPLDPLHWLLNVLKGPMGPYLENSRTFIGVYFDLLVRNRTSRDMYRTIIYKPNAPLTISQITLKLIEEYETFEKTNIDRLVKNLPSLETPPHLRPVYQSIEVVNKSLENYPGSNSEMREFRQMVYFICLIISYLVYPPMASDVVISGLQPPCIPIGH